MKTTEWNVIEREFRQTLELYFGTQAAQHARFVASAVDTLEAKELEAMASAAREHDSGAFQRLWQRRYSGWNNADNVHRFLAASRGIENEGEFISSAMQFARLYIEASQEVDVQRSDDFNRIDDYVTKRWDGRVAIDDAFYALYVAWNPESLIILPDRRLDLAKLFVDSKESIHVLTGRQFEEFVAYVLESLGCTVKLTQQTRDFGADILAWSAGPFGAQLLTAVQVKRYSPGRRVGLKEIYEAHGAVAHYRADAGQVVTTSTFTGPGEMFATTHGLRLVDMNALVEELKRLLRSRGR